MIMCSDMFCLSNCICGCTCVRVMHAVVRIIHENHVKYVLWYV